MATISYTYNLDSKTWTSPSGTAGTNFLPSLTFGEKPTLEITLSGTLPQGITSVTSWSCAIAKDWLKSTSPMARTTEDITYDDGVFTLPIDTCTDRFLAVVDGQGNGVPCWMQITGYDETHTPTVEITLPLLCNPALDPVGAGTIPPIQVTELSKAQVQTMIDVSIEAAENEGTTGYTAYNRAIEPGKVYNITLDADLTINAATTVEGYGESVLFVAVGSHEINQGEGIAQWDVDTEENTAVRLLASWSPIGVIIEQTGAWETSNGNRETMEDDDAK